MYNYYMYIIIFNRKKSNACLLPLAMKLRQVRNHKRLSAPQRMSLDH